jgi:hypothetical protein
VKAPGRDLSADYADRKRSYEKAQRKPEPKFELSDNPKIGILSFEPFCGSFFLESVYLCNLRIEILGQGGEIVAFPGRKL